MQVTDRVETGKTRHYVPSQAVSFLQILSFQKKLSYNGVTKNVCLQNKEQYSRKFNFHNCFPIGTIYLFLMTLPQSGTQHLFSINKKVNGEHTLTDHVHNCFPSTNHHMQILKWQWLANRCMDLFLCREAPLCVSFPIVGILLNGFLVNMALALPQASLSHSSLIPNP